MLQRTLNTPSDQDAMLALARACADENLHTSDLPYRLSSWAMDDPANTALWWDDEGQLAAWAVLQAPFWCLDYAYRTGDPGLATVLQWGQARMQAVRGSSFHRPAWFVNVFRRQTGRIHTLEAAGFSNQEHPSSGDDPWSKVWMRRALGAPPDALPLPEGFLLRPLAGSGEVEAYVHLHQTVFESKTMTNAWRARTLAQPYYQPELDLVIQAPDGRLAAFCIGWLDRQGRGGAPCGQIEPMGVHPDFRRLGLAQALLREALRRFHYQGAQHAFVETDNYRDAAFHVYQSAGFEVIEDVLVFRKDLE